jgi:hypothetical protein
VRWLREPVASITVARDVRGTQDVLLSTLRNLGISCSVSPLPPRIVANCVTLCANYVLWRCWADQLEFQFEEGADGQTRVHVTALPNLLMRVPKPGQVVDLGKLLSALRA